MVAHIDLANYDLRKQLHHEGRQITGNATEQRNHAKMIANTRRQTQLAPENHQATHTSTRKKHHDGKSIETRIDNKTQAFSDLHD